MSVRILVGDVRETLAQLPDASVQCCVTSPPYFGLRDYGHAGQIGLEQTPDAYVAELVGVFRDVRRVLREDGTLWLNLGDSYARAGGEGGHGPNAQVGNTKSLQQRRMLQPPVGCKAKDLLGIPWRVAFALQADGWYLRSDIIWHKPNPMPESVTDRPTKAHEYVFLLTKSARYYYDAGAIAEVVANTTRERLSQPSLAQQEGSHRVPGKTNGTMKAVPPRFGGTKYGENDAPEHRTKSGNEYTFADRRNARTVWPIATQPFKGAHFATMPPDLAERCIKAGTKAGDTVLDPFGGAGTTGLVADRLGRDSVLCELNPTYAAMARDRIKADNPLFSEVA